MRVLVCGSRYFDNEPFIFDELRKLPEGTTIISGGATGADSIAHKFAKLNEYPVKVFQAEWSKYGRAAGPIRNQKMLDEGKPDLVLAFFKEKYSAGTVDMVSRAREAGVEVKEFIV